MRTTAWSGCICCLLGITATGAFAGDQPAWRYVVPEAGHDDAEPSFRALGMRPERPEDVVEKADYRGSRRRYAQLRYGSPGSVRVTVVLDQAASGEVDLYVDADRNRRIEAKDRIEGHGRIWRLPLNVAIVHGELTRLERRAAVFRLGASGTTFSFATAGYLEGRVRLGGREHAARRVDEDGNGFVTDPQDQLWVDLDDDGRFDPAHERFLFGPILALGGTRYSVRSDTLGDRLTFEPLVGAGTVRLVMDSVPRSRRVTELSVTLFGRDGAAVSLVGVGSDVRVPTGDYRVGAVSATFDDPAGGPSWSYVFADGGRRGEPKWRRVYDGETLLIDPIGTIAFGVSVTDDLPPDHAGGPVRVQPVLYNGDGLLIVTCYRGSQQASPASDNGPRAEISLTAADGHVLDVAHSGFA